MATNTEELELLINQDTPKDETLERHLETTQISISIEEQEVKKEEAHLDEEIKSKLNLVETNAEQDKIQKIIITKEIFEQIKKSLQDTIKSMEKNPSIFSRAAEFWGQLPLWQKILGGVALTVPTLLIGILANIGFLLAICGVTAVTYAAGGLILDDHHKCSTSAVESLQKGILGLADLLELTIKALDVIRQQLALEIQKFARENQRLTENIEALSNKIDLIDRQVMATSRVNITLTETKDDLVRVSEDLKEGVHQHGDFLKQNQDKLDRITEGFNATQRELAEKLQEVQRLRSEMAKDLELANAMISTLNSTLSELSEIRIGDEEQKKAFQAKLNEFVTNKEASFLQIADRICAAENKLAITQKELEQSNQRYQQLLDRQEKQIDRMSTLPHMETTYRGTPIADILTKIGVLASHSNKEIPANDEPVHNSTPELT
ncbi:inclusion membrane protein A [Legionella wadsworthii]|uniref:Inclusion membrane protein A n=1 Tax=Legionella wadsworthii TaxID=28088 RepID=A0A378LVU5_9GAMM|nr:LegC2/C7 family Dot/Icm T4SS effector [Legionella wadsworthii]STY31753.1 inclusion membrane protein A [Legionella wadsworthii]